MLSSICCGSHSTHCELPSPLLQGMAFCPRQSFWGTRKLTAGPAHLFPIVHFLTKTMALKFHVLCSTCIPKYVQEHLVFGEEKVGLLI